MPKASQRQFLVKVAGIDGFFATKTGGNVSSTISKVYDGGSLTPDVLSAPAEAENVVVTRPYDPRRHPQLLARLKRQVGRASFTVSITPTDRDLVAVARPVTYPDALLVGVNDPDVDAASGDAATLQLEFAVGSWR